MVSQTQYGKKLVDLFERNRCRLTRQYLQQIKPKEKKRKKKRINSIKQQRKKHSWMVWDLYIYIYMGSSVLFRSQWPFACQMRRKSNKKRKKRIISVNSGLNIAIDNLYGLNDSKERNITMGHWIYVPETEIIVNKISLRNLVVEWQMTNWGSDISIQVWRDILLFK